MSTSAGWYPDPSGAFGQLRYWDGAAWTAHVAAAGPARSPWPGARYGIPASGPGALAEPWQRLVAQLLDLLIVLPVLVGFYALFVFTALPALFSSSTSSSSGAPDGGVVVGIVAIYIGFFVVGFGLLFVMPLYQSLTTGWMGRSVGKAVMRIRPVTRDGARLTWGRSFGRAFLYAAMGLVNALQLVDVLWCLWDENRECLHDKACETLVVVD